ncbi:sugar ABC transporter ATP-binding protein [Dulcicalothrix desertica PCC 7102]|uniref:Sugar ABC transporter ATP-binding protein n=1 Tax=Dulcicalothrix desertica PCC 7102 TaxID=232991 RepID=A0A433VNG6_9CYAN|nr:ABC transporter ATP-binding protein [Dulcicalothrix desertica]RUT07601.1 sugar ABC transporter ATP-binding protein [Dulcicalothrix desertica PCC 7102]TWH39770.1 lipopolysaccharide transport system ATP-binding protein [Dulcicalothrix desertica PCC 7102]
MGEELAISLKNVSKCYKRYGRPVDKLKEVLLPGKNYAAEFWALRDVNLEIPKGETVGIIGQNGSGKSTLLQIIAGTLTPTTGDVLVNGRVSALLELGSGFNPEFTGRQNVFFNGRILGLSQEEIENKFDEIVAFADIGEFLDQPVKTYSSGMFVRLAFSVAINANPDILIVDEALAVGDIFFQQKCFKFLEKLREKGTAILLVSHDNQAILKLCDHAVILQHGQLTHSGQPSEIVPKYIELYYSQHTEESAPTILSQINTIAEMGIDYITDIPEGFVQPENFICEFPNKNRYGSMIGLINGISISGIDGKIKKIFEVGEEFILSVKISSHQVEICPLNIGFQIRDRLGQMIVGTNTCMLSLIINQGKFGQPLICQFQTKLPIYPQQYTIQVAVAEYEHDAKVIYDWIDNATVIDVISNSRLKQSGICFPDIVVANV